MAWLQGEDEASDFGLDLEVLPGRSDGRGKRRVGTRRGEGREEERPGASKKRHRTDAREDPGDHAQGAQLVNGQASEDHRRVEAERGQEVEAEARSHREDQPRHADGSHGHRDPYHVS